MARVSPLHSNDSEELAPAKSQQSKKTEQAMEVDDEGGSQADSEEFEIEAILDAKKGSFPDV
jgi:hypothetical protein